MAGRWDTITTDDGAMRCYVSGDGGPAIIVAQHAGFAAVLACCLAATVAWLAVAWNMGDFLPAAAPATRT